MAFAGGIAQLSFEVGHIIMRVTVTRCLAQADTVDERGVIECVRDDGVVFIEQRFEDAAVGVERCGIEDGILHAEEVGDGSFQLFVYRLRAADKAYRRQSVAVAFDGLCCGLRQRFVAGQAKIIVGTEVDQLPPVVAGNGAALARREYALLLV